MWISRRRNKSLNREEGRRKISHLPIPKVQEGKEETMHTREQEGKEEIIYTREEKYQTS
jgi:hypothetical protein